MSNLETEVAVLGQQVKQMGDLFTRLDTAIEKISDMSGSITRMLAVHEEKHSLHERTEEELFQLIEKQKTEMQREVRDLHTRISTTSKEQVAAQNESEHRIMEAISDLKKAIKEDRTEAKTETNSIINRLNALEKWRWIILGGSAIAAWLLSYVIPILIKLI